MFRNHLSLCALLLALTFTCSSTPNPDQTVLAATDLPTRRTLFNNLRNAKLLTVVHSENESYGAMVDSLAKNPRFDLQIIAKTADKVQLTDLQSGAFFLIGTPQNNPLIQQLSPQLPFSITDNGFVFDGKPYTHPNDVFKLYLYPNPQNPDFPIYLISGNSEAGIDEMLHRKYADDWSSLMWASWGYEIYQQNHLKLLGYFSDTTWLMNKAVHFDFSDASDTLGQTAHFTFIAHNHPLEEGQLLNLMKQCEAGYENISSFSGQNIDKSINYHIYPTIEQKGLMMDNTDPAQSDLRSFSVHNVINDIFQGHQLKKENELLLRHFFGKPQKLALEQGLAIYFTDQWQKKGYKHWAAKLYHSGNLPGLVELLDNERFRNESELVMGAAAATLVEALIEHWGKDAFLQQYQTWNPSFKEMAQMEKVWHQLLEKIEIPDHQPKHAALPFLKGFNFAHEGYRIYNGYGSDLARQSLVKLANLGTNAIAIVPYSYMRDPEKPSPIPVIQHAGSETDESVIFAHAEAQKLGMYTMLKPQIWLGRSWPGEIAMSNENDWNSFFDYYYRWIRHYALLAEIYEMDALSLGVEFAKATIQRPEDWRRMVKKIRGLYSGHLTYSANWGEEFEKFSFWQDFDYIGLNCYYPLSNKEEINKNELKQHFRKVLDKIEKISVQYDKPVVFTEIGFRSVAKAWENPHAEANGRAYDENAQDICYEVVFEGIKGKDWCKGILWWKWPTYLAYRGRDNTGFTPNTKKAEKTVAQWFGKF